MKKTIIILLNLGFLIISCQTKIGENKTLDSIDSRGIPKKLTEIKKENTKNDLSNAFKVYIDSENHISINNKKISINELKKAIRDYQSKYESKSVIIFESSRATDYGFYIEVHNAIVGEIKYLRELLANRRFNTKLDSLSDKQLFEIKKVYPEKIIN
ncbi:ExbD/TolR family protein [Tenacibaculum ovolyticum]|uniref:ExbD/TolR family protein n=1 Tax=Tenacibaculum ovolyticum TaxID=104270 RepID=UPI0007EC7594|nr:hypothetical protein [Tenacibaculum ovolyticum]